MMTSGEFDLFISHPIARSRLLCIDSNCPKFKGFTLDSGGNKVDGKLQRRLRFKCCGSTAVYLRYASSILKFCSENGIDLKSGALSLASSTPEVPVRYPNGSPTVSEMEANQSSFNADDALQEEGSLLEFTPAHQDNDNKRRRLAEIDSGSEGETELPVATVGANEITTMMKSMIATLTTELKTQFVTQMAVCVNEALAANNSMMQDRMDAMAKEHQELKQLVLNMQKAPGSPNTKTATYANALRSTSPPHHQQSPTPNGRKSPALQKPVSVDMTRYLKDETKSEEFNELLGKLNRSNKPAMNQELVTIYALRVRDVKQKDVRKLLRMTSFNTRVIRDICYVARNTLAFTVIKSSVVMLEEVLNNLFGWTTTMNFDASKPYNAAAPEEVKAQVRASSIKNYAKFMFRAEFVTKNTMLLDFYKKFVADKGQDYSKAVMVFYENIKQCPQNYFPNYKSDEPDSPKTQGEQTNGMTLVEETQVAMEECPPDRQTVNSDSVLNIPETSIADMDWSDEPVDIDENLSVEYDTVVPAAAEDPLLC
jgi:hypothetical protein